MLEALRKIVQEVNSAPDLESVLRVIVRRVQRAVRTDVCSIYLLDPATQRFILKATQGLNKKSVGQASLSRSEGIVGLVGERAEPINLEDASKHQAYSYIQETGEEKFHAFLGVPIIHHRELLGVLVVQQEAIRRFDETEEAFMVTMSAQLAGVIAHAEATGSIGKLDDVKNKGKTDRKFEGVSGCVGVAIGQAVVMTPLADLNGVPDRQAKDIELEKRNSRTRWHPSAKISRRLPAVYPSGCAQKSGSCLMSTCVCWMTMRWPAKWLRRLKTVTGRRVHCVRLLRNMSVSFP